LTGSQKEKYKSPSYQIREGDSVNIDVTSPGATLALGMMYFNTGNRYCLVYLYNVKVHTAAVFRVTMDIVDINTNWERVGRIEKEENVVSPPPPFACHAMTI
jgi:hypothetical protein